MKIRTKLGVFPIALAIMLIVSLLITIIISKNIVQKQVGNHLLTTAQSRAHNIETLLNDDKKTVRILSVGIPFTNGLDPTIDYTKRMTECNLRIKRTIEIDPDISRIRVLNKNGIVIASSHEDVGFDQSAEEIFLKGKDNVYIGEIHKSEYTGNLVFSISAPIFVRDIFSGVLIVNFDIEKQLCEIVTDRTGLGKTGEIYLVNKDGYRITPSIFIDDAIFKIKISTEQVNLFLTEHMEEGLPEKMEKKPTEYLDYRGEKVLGLHNYIPGMQLCLIAEIDVEEAYKPINKQIILLIIVFSILLVLTIIVVIIISKDITLPIIKLHEGTEEIIKGNIDYKVSTKAKDEIGQLSRSFDIMTTRLTESQKELQKRADELDEKVQERTAELEKHYEKKEKQRIANLSVLNDLNKTTRDLRAEINEREQAEVALRESQERFQDIVTNTGDWIWETDEKGCYTYCSPVVKQVLGYEDKEVLGKHFYDFFIPEKKEEMKKVALKSFTQKKPFKNFINRNIHKDDYEVILETSGVPMLDDKGNLVGYRGVDRDITERIQAENVQRALYDISNTLNTVDNLHELIIKIREYLGNVIDTTNFYVALYDEKADMISLPFDVDEKDEFETFPAGKTLTKYVIQLGEPLFAPRKLQDELNKQGKIDIIGTRSEIWLGVPLKVENIIIGVIAVQSYVDPNLYSEKDIDILTFISEEIALAIKHKQADENIRHSHKELKELHRGLEIKVKKAVNELREKDHIIIQQSRHAAMGEMIGNIAHQWRQPLQAIAGIIQNYEDAYEDGTLDMEYIEKHTDKIMDILTEMSRTIDDFRFFFKPNKLKENFNVKDIINKTIKFLESSLNFNQIKIFLDLEENCIINGFQNEYSQVVLIILSNAKDELVERKIKDKKISIVLKKIEDKFVLRISDNAGGITKEVMSKIFDPYFTTKEQGKGTGVGLYMAKMIIEKNMGGKLTARNLKDGAEFRIEV